MKINLNIMKNLVLYIKQKTFYHSSKKIIENVYFFTPLTTRDPFSKRFLENVFVIFFPNN